MKYISRLLYSDGFEEYYIERGVPSVKKVAKYFENGALRVFLIPLLGFAAYRYLRRRLM